MRARLTMEAFIKSFHLELQSRRPNSWHFLCFTHLLIESERWQPFCDFGGHDTFSADQKADQDSQMYINLILRILIGVVVAFLSLFFVIGIIIVVRKIRRNRNKESSLEHSRNSDEAVKKDFEDAPDANEKGPDIIPQSAESEGRAAIHYSLYKSSVTLTIGTDFSLIRSPI
ncbi:nephrin [Caerostris darwini]|uniref:Nephrin n=1 Tax=Caerostris darwini TaxID=1538125 RepID=A0AAV4MEG0_9ARAC|nr:nephrin [Caerostris darwini]